MRVLFLGNGEPFLRALIEDGQKVVTAVADPMYDDARPYFGCVPETAIRVGIPVIPQKVFRERALSFVSELSPDVIVVSGYRYRIPPQVFRYPPYGAINIHASLLPRYRGRHPLNWAIISGETKTGITIHYVDEGLDTGDIILQEAVDVGPNEDVITVYYKIRNLGVRLITTALRQLERGEARRVPQDETLASYFPPRRPENGLINWNQSARSIHNLVRALVKPYTGAFTFWERKKLTTWKSHPQHVGTALKPGEVGDCLEGGGFCVGTEEGFLVVLTASLDEEGEMAGDVCYRMCGLCHGDMLHK